MSSHLTELPFHQDIFNIWKIEFTQHGLKVGDTIIEEFGDDSIGVRSSKGDFHSVNLDKGKRIVKVPP